MRKQLLRNKINELLSTGTPHTLNVFIDDSDLKWVLTSTLSPDEISKKIKSDFKEPRLYREVPIKGNDLTVTVTSEQAAEEIIPLLTAL
ncbi:MAG: hypothetical protein RBS37_13875 [Bacteroidales bacterium]|jgi:hypothetical protein|nr:hypothetical protein [Bacteroidales bacterium]